MSKKYLISLHGDGDHVYMIVGEAAWNWIESDRPDFGGTFGAEEQVPADVIAESGGKMPATVYVTTGSCENDRALALQEGYEVLERHPRKIEIEDCWEGFIY